MEVHGKLLGADNKGSGYRCGPCHRDNVATPADGFCKECREGMCNSCFQQHLRVKSCVNHVKVGVQSVSTLSLSDEDDDEDAVKCGKHRGQIVKFYCRSHEAVGCGECMLFDHKVCDHEYVKNVSKTFKQTEEYQRLARKVEDLSSTIKTTESQIEQERGSNQAMLTNTLAGVRKFRLDVNKYLDKVEADLISEAKQLLASNDKLLATMEEKCRQVSSELKKIQEKIDANVYKDTVLFVNAIEGKPNLSDIEQSLAQLNPKHIKNFEFVADEQLRNAVSSMRKLGTLTGNQAIQSDSENPTGVPGVSGTSIPPQQSQKQTQNVVTIKETRKTSGRQTDADVASGSSVPTKQSQEQTQNVGRTKVHLLLNKYQGQQHVNATDAAGNQSVVQEASMTFSAFNQVQKQRQHIKVDKHAHDAAGNQSVVEEVPRTSSASNQVQKEKQLKQENTETRKTSGRQTDADVASGSSVPTKQSQEQMQNVGRTKDVKPTVVVGARVRSNFTGYADYTGTVIAVLSNGKVKVMWDDGGEDKRTVGDEPWEVTIIG